MRPGRSGRGRGALESGAVPVDAGGLSESSLQSGDRRVGEALQAGPPAVDRRPQHAAEVVDVVGGEFQARRAVFDKAAGAPCVRHDRDHFGQERFQHREAEGLVGTKVQQEVGLRQPVLDVGDEAVEPDVGQWRASRPQLLQFRAGAEDVEMEARQAVALDGLNQQVDLLDRIDARHDGDPDALRIDRAFEKRGWRIRRST